MRVSETVAQKGHKLDVLLYGTAAALAIVGGVAAIATRSDVEAVGPPATALAGTSGEDEAEEGAELDAHDAPRVAPSLPDVPDLLAEPPPSRPGDAEDPRLAQLGAEMRFLSRARELLEESPDAAFAVLEQHRRAHPNGILREEREAFAIEALVSLDRLDAAERRYYDFQRSFPQSDFASRLRTLMR